MALLSGKASLWGAFFVFWLLAPTAHAEYCSQPDAGEAVSSKRVIDGDTLDLADGRRVRLIGINAPEMGRDGQPSEPYAQAARRELQRLVSGSKLRIIIGAQPQDRYGRTLGHLFDARGANIEARLLMRGLGFTVGLPPNTGLLECHLQHEQHARQRDLGVWQHPPVRRAAQVEPGFQLVRGRIERVSRSREHVWLDMDGPLTLRLPRDMVGVDQLLRATGRELEVRGWVVDRGRARPGQKRYMLPQAEARLMFLQ